MATLLVPDVPDELYEKIRQRAEAENRPLGAEVVTLLEQAVQQAKRSPMEALEEIRRNRVSYPREKQVPDSVDLLREDRDR